MFLSHAEQRVALEGFSVMKTSSSPVRTKLTNTNKELTATVEEIVSRVRRENCESMAHGEERRKRKLHGYYLG